MANKINVKLILELLQTPMSQREIIETRHISSKSITAVCRRAAELGISYADLVDKSDDEVYLLFFPDKFQKETMYASVNYEYVHSELKKTGVTLKLLWQEYKDGVKNGIPVGYTKFRDDYAKYVEQNNLTTTEMQLVPIAKLVPYVNNARTHSPEQINKLRSSLREFGFINPVIIDRDFGVIAGHGRILAAKEEGITEVPCVFADHLTEAQKKAYIIADNRMAMDAGWDEELLRVEIEALQGMDFDPLLTGFDEKELADLFGTESDSEAKDDDFDLTAALEKASFVERGDIWTVGRHRLMCGDATDAGDVALLMGGRKANLIVTDPPYGVSFKSSSGLTIQNDSMKNEEFYNFLFAAFKCMAD